jgi:uncharacterized membrane protein
VEAYNWLLLGHILAAITWVGGAIAMQIVGARLYRAESAEAVAAFARTAEYLGTRMFMPASLAVLAFGIAMVAVNEAWTIGQLWIILALVGIGISGIGGAVFFGPQSKRIGEALRSEGPQSQRARTLIRQIFVVGRVDVLILLLVVADMVLKPGL